MVAVWASVKQKSRQNVEICCRGKIESIYPLGLAGGTAFGFLLASWIPPPAVSRSSAASRNRAMSDGLLASRLSLSAASTRPTKRPIGRTALHLKLDELDPRQARNKMLDLRT